MHRGFGSRLAATGGIWLMLTAGAFAQAMQTQQLNGQSAVDEATPQWARPYLLSGFAGANSQPAFTTRLGSGTFAIFADSSDSVRVGGTPMFSSPAPLRQNWFSSSFPDSAWRSSSVFGSYKSDPTTGLFNGLYTTASFGATSIKPNPLGFSGLPGLSSGEVTGVTASAGVGLQLTPQISIEGSVSWTQTPTSTFR